MTPTAESVGRLASPRALRTHRTDRWSKRREARCPRASSHREITDAFSRFGFDDGDGLNFTDEVVAAIEAVGPYRCQTDAQGLHNYAIEAIDEQVAPGRWGRIAEFDGYSLPEWARLPEALRDALVALNNGEPIAWRLDR